MIICVCFINVFQRGYKIQSSNVQSTLELFCPAGKKTLMNFIVCFKIDWSMFFFVQLLVFEDLEVPSHKTKNIVQYIRQMDDTKKVLLVDGGDIDKKLKLATQNLHYVNVLPSIVSSVISVLEV